jgi:Tfp pilus assembly protein PilN
MIRINLLPVKEVKKKKVRKEFLLLVAILVALDVMVLMSWGGAAEEGLTVVKSRNKALQEQVDSLKEAKAQIEEREQNKALLEAQNFIFDKLKFDKIGPSNLLLFLSYVLTKPEDSAQNREEIKKREVIGWNVDWDADAVWLTNIVEKDGMVRMKGEARNHEDVAEFLKRLEAGVFFYKPELIRQEKKFHLQLETHYVDFEIVADLNYNLDGFPTALTTVGKKK